MQNIDFSSRINRPSPFATGGRPVPTSVATPVGAAGHEMPAPASGGDLKRRNRNMVFVIALLILAFTVGLMAGIQLGYLRYVDQSLVKNPDPETATQTADNSSNSSGESGTSSFANTSPHTEEAIADHIDGRYLVRVGTFAPRAAELLAGRLNNHPDLAQSKPVRCKSVRESSPGRYLAFRVKLDDGSDRQNVFLGCFRSEDAARRALDTAIASGIPGLSAARLFEIE